MSCVRGEREPGEAIVLATDGFMRLVDVFGAYSDARSMPRSLRAGRNSCRNCEKGSEATLMAGAYPRVKTHDDATFLVIAAGPQA